jgi:D-alanine-D-alanine ligase-like ATP-grasp enzyme
MAPKTLSKQDMILTEDGYVPDFSQPAFYDEILELTDHEGTAYFMILAALLDGYDVRFFRTIKEANVPEGRLSPEVRDAQFFEVSSGGIKRYFQGSFCSEIGIIAADDTRDKFKTKQLLHRVNVNTPIGGTASPNDLSLIQKMAAGGVKKFHLKPVGGSRARGVVANLTAQGAAEHIRKNPHVSFIVEQQIIGPEIRTVVVGDKVVAAFCREPQHVVGNGKQTIRALLYKRRDDRKVNPLFARRVIDEGQAEMALVQRGDTLDRIPAAGEKVLLFTNLKASASDNLPDCLDKLPLSTIEASIKAAKALNCPVAAFDCIVDRSGQTFILEANAKAMFGYLCLPHPTGRWNLRVPRAILARFLPKPKHPKRMITKIRFAELRAEVFREGRKEPVNAMDFVDLA